MLHKIMRQKFEGCLLGLVCGDALGAPVEFMTAEQISQRFGTLKEMVGGGWLNIKPGEYTDDTDMMLCIAESLAENKDYNPEDIARRFVEWYKSNPKDIGSTTRKSLARLASGVSWKESGDKNSPANGSVMRCAPIGLFFAFNKPELIRASIETSAITHAHNEATASCVFVNLMISNLLILDSGKASKYLADFRAFLTMVNELKQGAFLDKLTGPDYRPDPSKGLAINTTVLAKKSFILSNSFEEAVVTAVNLGGDTDTIGAVTGALAGTHWGSDEIPKRWLQKLNPYSLEKIKEIADTLFELAMSLKNGKAT